MDLSIIIVSWNVKDKLRHNLQALYQSNLGAGFEVIVVDNNSGDNSAEMVTTEFPKVRLIANSDNLGFAKANNQGIKLANGSFILLLNPDMQVFPDTLSNLLSVAKNLPTATVLGGHLLDQNGKTIQSVRRFPRLSDQLAIILKLPHIYPKILRQYLMIDFNYGQEQKVDSVRGALFLINRQQFKILTDQDIFLDERYFLWFEEVDFCRQVSVAGGAVYYTPKAECLDYVGASFDQLPRGQAQKYFRDSMLKYFAKWEKLWQTMILKIVWAPVVLVCKIFHF